MNDGGEPVALRGASGVVLLGERSIVHGKDLHQECMQQSYVAYALFCVTGREAEPVHARVLEEFWLATGYADPRIWCNRVAGYMASARVDPGLALSAAIAASDSMAYGFGAMRSAFRVQAEIPALPDQRAAWLSEQLTRGRLLHGYGRPIHGRDERIAAALRTLARNGLKAGPALHAAFWLDAELRAEKGIAMNISAIWAACAIDFGLSEQEYAEFMLLMFVPGYLAVYADQRKRPAHSFLPGQQSERR
ncbi:MAG TPA: citrate/2-methylcitrate synthase [Polyangiales bacterium]